MTIIAAIRQRVTAVRCHKSGAVMAIETLLISFGIQQCWLLGTMGRMTTATAFLYRLVAVFKGKKSAVVAVKAKLRQIVTEQKRVTAVVGLMTLQA